MYGLGWSDIGWRYEWSGRSKRRGQGNRKKRLIRGVRIKPSENIERAKGDVWSEIRRNSHRDRNGPYTIPKKVTL